MPRPHAHAGSSIVAIIDRDQDFRQLLTTLFTAAGFDTAASPDVRHGLAKAAQLRARRSVPCAIVVGVDHWNFDASRFNTARDRFRLTDVPVILLIGQPSLSVFSRELRAQDTLGKVESLTHVVTAVRRACSR